MRLLVISLLYCVSLSSHAAEDCAFDQGAQLAVLATVAQSTPGASLDLETREVTLGSAETGLTVFAYGGCEDLGSTVTRTTPMDSPRTLGQVFSVARELAERFWNNEHVVAARLASESLLAGLTEQRYETEHLDGSTLYSVRDAHYVELYVEHSYADGVDTVSIAWQGNF